MSARGRLPGPAQSEPALALRQQAANHRQGDLLLTAGHTNPVGGEAASLGLLAPPKRKSKLKIIDISTATVQWKSVTQTVGF